jgi:hypothetical protein
MLQQSDSSELMVAKKTHKRGKKRSKILYSLRKPLFWFPSVNKTVKYE